MKRIKNRHNIKWNYVKIKNFVYITLYDHLFSEYHFNIFLYNFQNHNNSWSNLAQCYIRLFLYFLFFNSLFFYYFLCRILSSESNHMYKKSDNNNHDDNDDIDDDNSWKRPLQVQRKVYNCHLNESVIEIKIIAFQLPFYSFSYFCFFIWMFEQKNQR